MVGPDVTDDALREMDELGVRGIRYNLARSSGPSHADLEHLARRVAPLGWHVQIHASGDLYPGLVPVQESLPVPVVIAAAPPRVVAMDRFRHLVDVGGGDGSLLLALLRQFLALRGTVFDRPGVVAGCEARDAAARLRVLGGDFFAGVPEGGGAYILKFILHDGADSEADLILRRCAEAM